MASHLTQRCYHASAPTRLPSIPGGLSSRCQKGKMNKGKSWGAAVVRQADKSAPVATMILDCANVANAGTVPNCRTVVSEVLIARYLRRLCYDNVRKDIARVGASLESPAYHWLVYPKGDSTSKGNRDSRTGP
ncbi:hypothetical protein CFAM422_004773 [Trichoderma lentiforme]|uniref:Uncharacterized protein n=1 Tax=Trichoderma lentiforme TaxID=1567552 RepID=A0A9P5CCZ3_9HYPO|nr:hypothetical protein CFAM422_004773 [Trichoderma lentiforme]